METSRNAILICRDVLDLPTEERTGYYNRHGVNEALRREVESLLSFDTREGSRIEEIVQHTVGLSFQEPVGEGGQCGPYRLLSLIGRGGMGLVYLAERVDGEVRQHVAVKLLRAGADTGLGRQRFMQERQILADLTHPNIGRLLDAGHREDGQPYLVMEFIEGRTIDAFCSGLGVPDRVRLITQVAEAIAYAHQKLVVHRDLKPGNILVDASGIPKLLDFGIAKLMDVGVEQTATLERHLTPEYASPEQLEGRTIGTASDIYSLGSVLQKLLTLDAPSRVEPDLHAIVQKAMRREPEERYRTADQLADDLRAWLDHRPVKARQGERWYQARRYLRRYWVPVTAGVVAFTGLTGGLLMARRERDVAQRRFHEVRALANELFAVEKDIQSLTGATAVRERIVNISLQYLERLSKEAGGDLELKSQLASGYRKVAEAQGVHRGTNLGHTKEAQASLEKAEALYRGVWKSKPHDRQALRNVIEVVDLQSRMEYEHKRMNELGVRIADLQLLLSGYEPLAGDTPDEWKFLGEVYNSMALAGADLLRLDDAARYASRAVDYRRKSFEANRVTETRGSYANALWSFARISRLRGGINESIQAMQEAAAETQKIVDAEPQNFRARLNLANTYVGIGRAIGDEDAPSLGRWQEAAEYYDKAFILGRELIAADPKENTVRTNQAICAWRLGDVLKRHDPARALAAYAEATALLRPMKAGTFPRDVPLVSVLTRSTFALRSLHRDDEARRNLNEAIAIAEFYRQKPGPAWSICRDDISRAEAEWALAAGRPAEAVALHQAWLKLIDSDGAQAIDEAKQDLHSAYVLSRRYALLAEALRANGKAAEADATEAKRREVAGWWRSRLAGDLTERILLRPKM